MKFLENKSMYIIGNVNVEEWIEMLKNLKLQSDVSTYAPGRKRLWLNGLGEPFLGKRPKIFKSHKNDKIHEAITKLGIKYDFCLVHYSGEDAAGIGAHRDASYAQPIAYGINLGKCKFTVNSKTYELTGGEVYKFNCKLIHSAKPEAHRWGINLWTVKQEWLSQVNCY